MIDKNELCVKPIPKEETYSWLLHKHYAHRIPSIMYSYGLFNLNNIVGVCTFGLPPAENCLLLCGETYKDKTVELNRLIKDDGLPENSQSYFASNAIKLLPKPMIVISYADPNNGHQGYTYQALNFYFTGNGGAPEEYVWNGKQYTTRHIKDYWFNANGLAYDPTLTIRDNFLRAGGTIIEMQPKNRYVLFCGSKTQKKDMLKNLKWPILPYPKGENKRYDTNKKIDRQIFMF